LPREAHGQYARATREREGPAADGEGYLAVVRRVVAIGLRLGVDC